MTSGAITAPSRSVSLSPVTAYWILRIGAAACFIGHGAFGFITKAAWLPYFGAVGIPADAAMKLMPFIGAVDVLAGMAVLFAPTRVPLVYMAVWATWTALLRPLTGESVFEAVERAGNYGVPIALLVLSGLPFGWRSLTAAVDAGALRRDAEATAMRVLRWATAMLLAGHGLLAAVVQKPLFASHFATLGLPASATVVAGWLEVALAVLVLARPLAPVLVLVAVWKLVTESLFLAAGAPVWELVERAGSIAAPLALAVLLLVRGRTDRQTDRRTGRTGRTDGQ